jgi:hypothetical protein
VATIGRTVGNVSELTIVGRVVAERLDGLRAALRELDGQPLFDALGTVHFARWVILAPDGDQGASYLFFTSNYDGPLDQYLAAQAAAIPEALAATWGSCEGWPGSTGLAEWTAFVERNAITSSMFYAAYPDASVGDVRRGLRVDTAVQDLLDAMQA